MVIRKNMSDDDEVCTSALTLWSDKNRSGYFTGKAKRWKNGSKEYGSIELLFISPAVDVITYVSEFL